MVEILDLDNLLAQLVLAIGAALLAGNAYALIRTGAGLGQRESRASCADRVPGGS